MDKSRAEKLESLFAAAVEMSPEHRSAFLERACDGDRALREEIEALLAHAHESGQDALPALPSLLGRQLGNYQVLALVGRGGMGLVFDAKHVHLGHKVAVKVLLPWASEKPGMAERFFNEAKYASSLRHPGIVDVHDFGKSEPGGRAYLVMEYLDGPSLKDQINRYGALSPDYSVAITEQLADALAAAHAQGIVHRDLKPENIMLIPDTAVPLGERVKLLDFGIAKVTDNESAPFQTAAGQFVGTPQYMAPEQCSSAVPVDHRADLYALGCIMYCMLCGSPPFTSEDPLDVLMMQKMLDPEPLGGLGIVVDADLEAIVFELLAKDPQDRIQSAAELVLRLQAIGSSRAAHARPSQHRGERQARPRKRSEAQDERAVKAPAAGRRAEFIHALAHALMGKDLVRQPASDEFGPYQASFVGIRTRYITLSIDTFAIADGTGLSLTAIAESHRRFHDYLESWRPAFPVARAVKKKGVLCFVFDRVTHEQVQFIRDQQADTEQQGPRILDGARTVSWCIDLDTAQCYAYEFVLPMFPPAAASFYPGRAWLEAFVRQFRYTDS